MNVRGEPPLWLDGGEVLDVVAEEPAQVLDQPVEQRGEVQRVPRRPLIVVSVRIDGSAVRADLAVAVARERDEHGRPERLPVRRGVGLPDRPGRDRPAWQGRGILAAPGRAGAAFGPAGQDIAANARSGDLLV